VCNREWLPESLPLPDERKATITVRHLLNMTSGLDVQGPPIKNRPFEWSLGHVERSPMIKLLADPGTTFHYSNAGVSHLVLVFNHAVGDDLFPFLKRRLFDPIGMKNVTWRMIGGDGGIGPYNQGYAGIYTTLREHARFCYLAMHKGEWKLRRIVPAAYYDFAWTGTKAKTDYGAQWWIAVPEPGIPKDMVMTRGLNHNDGFIIPSLDLVFVRFGDGDRKTFPDAKNFQSQLVHKVLAAVVK
jgi:CubicO group peptidase (beta-lactamase class C family)